MLKIGFDAKRAFYNNRGLGNYSRGLIKVLSECQPENQYYLFTPKTKNALYNSYPTNCEIILPENSFYKALPSLWRSHGLCDEIKELNLDIFHGLSHELPIGIEKTKARSVVTMHDLIFIKYPELYPWIDRHLYKIKYFRSCRVADKIIAISEQTKRDLIDLAGIDEHKIEVVYQGCNPIFHKTLSQDERTIIKNKYDLPSQYLLNVGAIEVRKNQGQIVKALAHGNIDVPLIIIGRPTEYMNELKNLITSLHLEKSVRFLNNVPTEDLPAIYQMAEIFVYPSMFEGFGIPIIEALHSGIPVITSKDSCFEETGGPETCYINHENLDELVSAINNTLINSEKRKKMIDTGLVYVEKFSDSYISGALMNVYKKTPLITMAVHEQKETSSATTQVSLIISFYNNIELLKMIFAALKKQSSQNFEVIIADDGSRKEIVTQIHELIKTVNFPVKHCWHEDNGWQKNRILNEAIRQSEGFYLIFMDGDCIPHHNFIEEHFNARREKKVITGRRVQLTEKMTGKLRVSLIEAGKLERVWLKLLFLAVFCKVKHVENAIRIKNKFLRRLLVKDKENGILGCNFSIFKSDILKVNGFDERFRHPGTGEDTDLNSRLLRAGVGTISKKHMLTIYHIYHKKFDLAHQPNIDLWNENNENQITFTPFGIIK